MCERFRISNVFMIFTLDKYFQASFILAHVIILSKRSMNKVMLNFVGYLMIDIILSMSLQIVDFLFCFLYVIDFIEDLVGFFGGNVLFDGFQGGSG